MLRARLLLLVALAVAAIPASAETRRVAADPGALRMAVAGAAPGDVLRLAAGIHDGPITVAAAITLDGDPGATIRGDGTGNVVTVAGDDVTLRGLVVEGSGSDATAIDSGILVRKGVRDAVIESNRLVGNLHGVTLHGAIDAVVRANVIEGRAGGRVNDRGNGVYVWNAPGALVEGNDIRFGRDGIFANASKKNVFRANRMRGVRFAVHYMYTNDSVVSGNISIGNTLGFALMFSNKITVTGNLSLGDRRYGLMLNYANNAVVSGNLVRGGLAEKCTFIYNAHKNRITGNRFEGCAIGIHFTAGSERNLIAGNAFIANRNQVKYVGTRHVEWSGEGRGNFWSDHAAFDLDGDGLADSVFRPNDLMDHILWSQPAAKLLLGSPAVQLVRWSQESFPAILPGGVTDSAPLIRPVTIEVPEDVAALERQALDDARNRTTTDDDPDPLASH